MKIKILLISIAWTIPSSWAASCYDTAMTQASISDCANAETKDRDKDLNTAYKALVNKHASDKAFREKLKKAQRAWIAYRDQELDLVDSDGSISSTCRSQRLAQLNKERTEYFKSLLDQKEGEVCAP